MSDTDLTALSTLAWLIGTVTLFALLAHWSAGASWGISAAITRGLIGWAGRNPGFAGEWTDDELGPIRSPRLDRLWGAGSASAPPAPNLPADQPIAELPIAELEDLGTRRLP